MDRVKDGDIFAVTNRGLFWSLVTQAQKLSGLGDYSNVVHTGFAYWIDGHLFSAEEDGSCNSFVSVKSMLESGSTIGVIRNPHTEQMRQVIIDSMLVHLPYSYEDIFRLAVRLVTGFQNHQVPSGEEVCSNFVLRRMLKAGWVKPDWLNPLCSPGEICKAIGPIEFTLTMEDLL